MTAHAGSDVDQVKRAIIEHRARIRVPLHAELLACSTRLGFVLITYCDKVGAMTGSSCHALEMVLASTPVFPINRYGPGARYSHAPSPLPSLFGCSKGGRFNLPTLRLLGPAVVTIGICRHGEPR